MFGPKMLDMKNVYIPDLKNIQESAERTYGEANSFYRKESLYLEDVEKRIKRGVLTSEKDIYDECHAIASDLAKCCEMYLKAIFISEHNVPGTQIDELWNKLINKDYATDEKGNLLYELPNKKITHPNYDDDGNPIVDADGKIIYFDDDNNMYRENTRGRKIPRSGHQLDRLIELLSPESKLLLETRMLTIPMDSTEKNQHVSILDVLKQKGVLPDEKQISSEQYTGWIDQHKKTFEIARYSGQLPSDVNIEFLYHLATQLRAVAQYRIIPGNFQNFTITDEELSKLPSEIRQLVISYPYLATEDLFKLIANDEKIKNRIIEVFSKEKVLLPKYLRPTTFIEMLKSLNGLEIEYVSCICFMMNNFKMVKNEFSKEPPSPEAKRTFQIARLFTMSGFSTDYVIKLLIQYKEVLGENRMLNNENVSMVIRMLRDIVAHKTIKIDGESTDELFNNDIYTAFKSDNKLISDAKYVYDMYNDFSNSKLF